MKPFDRDTWIKIKEEYKKGITDGFNTWLCSLSPTFALFWEDPIYHSIIVRKAKFFTEGTKWRVGGGILFKNVMASISERRQVRLDFIDYMIESFDNNERYEEWINERNENI